MKKYLLPGLFLAVLVFAVFYDGEQIGFGARVVLAIEGPEAVGIIVKNGTKMDTILSDNFIVSSLPCDPEATTTPQDMCDRIFFQGREVKVYYTADDNMVGKQSFNNKLGSFPFSGRIEYVNRAQADIEPKLVQFMLEQGNGSYSIIYEP